MPRRTDQLVKSAASYLNTNPNQAKRYIEEVQVIMGNSADTRQFVCRICPEQSEDLLLLINENS